MRKVDVLLLVDQAIFEVTGAQFGALRVHPGAMAWLEEVTTRGQGPDDRYFRACPVLVSRECQPNTVEWLNPERDTVLASLRVSS